MSKITVDHFKHISFADPQENIFYDDVLLAQAEASQVGSSDRQLGNTLRLWESPVYFIVLGRTGKVEEDLNIQAVQTDAIPVLRRSSGGGTVVQGPGCLNFSFILSKNSHPGLPDLRKSYHVILEGVLTLLMDMGVDAGFRPISDLALTDGEKKFSGNAQRRGREFILHHGTILYDFDLDLISRYLAIPRDIPEYRKGRPHRDFIANIPLSSVKLAQAFKKYFTNSNSMFTAVPALHEIELMKNLSETRSPLLKIQ